MAVSRFVRQPPDDTIIVDFANVAGIIRTCEIR